MHWFSWFFCLNWLKYVFSPKLNKQVIVQMTRELGCTETLSSLVIIDVEYSALTPCQRQQLAPGTGAMSTDAFRPQCTSSGEFRRTQCDSKRCWCVDTDGIRTSSAEVLLPKKPNCNRRRRPGHFRNWTNRSASFAAGRRNCFFLGISSFGRV